MQQPRKLDEAAVYGRRGLHSQIDPVALGLEAGTDLAKSFADVETPMRILEREIQILRKARQAIEETQRRAAVEGDGHHGARVLERSEDSCLQVLPYRVARVEPGAGPFNHEVAQEIFHRTSTSIAFSPARPITPATARRTLPDLKIRENLSSSSRSNPSSISRRSSARYASESEPFSR